MFLWYTSRASAGCVVFGAYLANWLRARMERMALAALPGWNVRGCHGWSLDIQSVNVSSPMPSRLSSMPYDASIVAT